jgi:hypothetical protein
MPQKINPPDKAKQSPEQKPASAKAKPSGKPATAAGPKGMPPKPSEPSKR